MDITKKQFRKEEMFNQKAGRHILQHLKNA